MDDKLEVLLYLLFELICEYKMSFSLRGVIDLHLQSDGARRPICFCGFQPWKTRPAGTKC